MQTPRSVSSGEKERRKQKNTKITKYELASYMVALIAIMESKEDAGRARGQGLGEEYDRCYAKLMKRIAKDRKDEK